MRRIAAVLGVLLVLLGVTTYEVTPADCGYKGESTAYTQSLRYDFAGDEQSALAAVENLGGKVLRREAIDGVVVLYAYSPRVFRRVTLFGERVNLMVAVRGDRVAIGSPMLEGSY